MGSCGCSGRTAEAFDARAAVRRLSRDVQALSDVLARYVEEAALDDRADRVARALEHAARLARIVGGTRVPAGAFPECALVGDDDEFFCSGTLVHPRAVLSAAHCARGGARPTRVRLACDTDVALGTEEEVRVLRTRVHPQYRPDGANDVALLLLERPAKTPPAPRATTKELVKATSVQLVGFGYDDPEASLGFGTKRQVNVPIGAMRRTPKQDLGALVDRLEFDPATEFVAGRKKLGRDTCNGDSGGPAYVKVGARWKLAGVTSRATADAVRACGDGGVYGRVDAHATWIDRLLAGL
jgi:endonuclease G